MRTDPMRRDEIIAELQGLQSECRAALAPLRGQQEIRALQASYLGKKGLVSSLMRHMGGLEPGDRKALGEAFNRVKEEIVSGVEGKLAELATAELEADLARVVDVTLPGRLPPKGHSHLLTQIRREAVAIFSELGFGVAEGPQVETDFHNFEALGFPSDHPARDEQDTFFLGGGSFLLRTHTSPVQVRTMLKTSPPVQVVAPGVVYRRDDDPTHSPMFTQIEGLWVDRGVRFSDLKGVLLHFVRRYFGESLKLRFRPSYFPFVEPGAEVDMECAFCRTGERSACRICKGTGWVEIGGSGMVDPVVFGHVGYDPEEFTGFAFGMGLERMAMLRHGVSDIKLYYEGDLRFLEQF